MFPGASKGHMLVLKPLSLGPNPPYTLMLGPAYETSWLLCQLLPRVSANKGRRGRWEEEEGLTPHAPQPWFFNRAVRVGSTSTFSQHLRSPPKCTPMLAGGSLGGSSAALPQYPWAAMGASCAFQSSHTSSMSSFC